MSQTWMGRGHVGLSTLGGCICQTLPVQQLRAAGLPTIGADLPIDEATPSLDEVRRAVAELRGRKAPGGCGISVELLKAGGKP